MNVAATLPASEQTREASAKNRSSSAGVMDGAFEAIFERSKDKRTSPGPGAGESSIVRENTVSEGEAGQAEPLPVHEPKLAAPPALTPAERPVPPETEATQEEDEVYNLLAKIIAILEGKNGQDMQSLMDRMNGAMDRAAAPLSEAAENLIRHLQARMPHANEMPQTDKKDFIAAIKEFCDHLCPLENTDEPMAETIPAQTRYVGKPSLPMAEAEPGQNKTGEAREGDAKAGAEEAPASEGSPPSAENPLRKDDFAAGDMPKRDAKDRGLPANTLRPAGRMDVSPDKVLGERQMQETVPVATKPNSPIAKENLFEALVQRMSLSQDKQTGQMHIQLKPEFMGKVSISLTMEGTQLHAKISAENEGIRHLIAGQVNQLIETLQNKGVRIESVDVVQPHLTGETMDQAKDRPAFEQKRSKALPSSILSRLAQSMVLEELDSSGYYLAADGLGLSSVEFRA